MLENQDTTENSNTPSSDGDGNPRKLKVWMPLLLSLMMVGGMVIGMKLQDIPLIQTRAAGNGTATPSLGGNQTGKVEELLRYIDARYVDEVDRDDLVNKAIRRILDELDPHSNYIPADQLRQVNEQLEGNFEGVGIEFLLVDDTILVVTAISEGPSDKVGIMAGDKIISIEDTIVAGVNMPTAEIVNKLRGVSGTKVTIGIKRGKQPVKQYEIVRDRIPLNSVDIAYMLDDKTGYIKLNRFSATTYTEFMKEMEDLIEKENMEDLVIDLRQNPGGYLNEATQILSQLFKDRKKLLVYTEGRTASRSDYETTGRQFFKVGKVALLIDEGSASASEIMAGAIQDWDRGVVIGRRSFGKGLVQEQYSLNDGSALRLTVARYYTPSGRSIQKSYGEDEDYEGDLIHRMESGELFIADSIFSGDTTRYYTKNDNRVVYGGGGITPDFFVPMDSLELDEYYLRLSQHVPQFVYRYLENHPETHDDISQKQFVKTFRVSDAMYQQFIRYAEDKGLNVPADRLQEIQFLVRTMLKARVARQYYGEGGRYAVIHEEDEMIRAALRAMRTERPIVQE